MYKIKTSEDPYSGLVTQFVASNFPRPSVHFSPELTELLTNEILGSKMTRFGPKPPVESQVAIRDVIRKYTKEGLPIPFMVPWGSEKPNGTGVDIAELSGLKTISCLSGAISRHYLAGAVFNIRVEDVSAPHLFYDRADQARAEAKLYSDAFEAMPRVLDMPFIKIVRESSIVDEATFNAEADKLITAFSEVITDVLQWTLMSKRGELSMQWLATQGWTGELQKVTIEHYLATYARMYPGENVENHIHRLARYFAASLTRKRLKLRGDDPAWDGSFIDLSFAGPVPGTEAVFGRRVNYRTIPSTITQNHLPPWRAKGYLKIGGDNEVNPALASFREEQEYNPNQVTLENNGESVTLQADYILI